MEELENRDDLDTEQEAPQDAQEAPVAAEATAGEETDTQEPETPPEAAEGGFAKAAELWSGKEAPALRAHLAPHDAAVWRVTR